MAELLDEVSQIESTTIAVQRTASTVKGGRRFSFGALVVVGDRRGKVGYGYGKSNEVPSAIEKAQKYARKAMVPIPMTGTTLPHEVEGSYRASKVRLIPAAPGTGVVAGASVRAVLEMAGITDCLTKCYGSTNSINTIKAVFAGLERIRVPGLVSELRGVQMGTTEIEKKIEKGKQFVTAMPRVRKAETRNERPERGRGGRGRSGGGGGGGGRGPRGPKPPESVAPEQPPAASSGEAPPQS
jgi:small subunit ribosomal protein S5